MVQKRKQVHFLSFILLAGCLALFVSSFGLVGGAVGMPDSPGQQETINAWQTALKTEMGGTNTWSPLFPSKTPQPTLNTDCDPSGILYLGTIQPDFYWQDICADCIASVTATYGMGTSTGVSQTVTPGATSTYMPTPVDGWFSIHSWAFTQQYFDDGLEYCTVQLIDGGNAIYMQGHLYGSSASGHRYDQDTCAVSFWGGVPGDTLYIAGQFVAYTGDGTGSNSPSGYGTGDWPGQWQGWALNEEYIVNTTRPVGSGRIDYSVVAQGGYDDGAWSALDFIIYFSRHPWNVEPTPTSAPTRMDTYCSEVLPFYPGGGDDESQFGLPVIRVGPAQCIDIDPFSLDLTLINEEWVFELPGFHICMAPIDFGEIRMFGLVWDLEKWGAVIACAYLMRLILRS